jgi:hypothetical protein
MTSTSAAGEPLRIDYEVALLEPNDYSFVHVYLFCLSGMIALCQQLNNDTRQGW